MNEIVVQPVDENILDLISLMELVKQTNQEKFEIIKPLFDRLHLYCDENSLRLDEDIDLFSIPLEAIESVEYEEEDDVLFILFKKNKTLHAINLSEKQHALYVSEEKRHCIVRFFLKIYNRIRFSYFCRKSRIK